MRSHRIYQDVKVPFLVEMVHGVKVELDGLFLLLRIGFVDVALRLDGLQDRFFLGPDNLKQRNVRMILTLLTGREHIEIYPLKIEVFDLLLTFMFFVRF